VSKRKTALFPIHSGAGLYFFVFIDLEAAEVRKLRDTEHDLPGLLRKRDRDLEVVSVDLNLETSSLELYDAFGNRQTEAGAFGMP
jgi:hypothetical protein